MQEIVPSISGHNKKLVRFFFHNDCYKISSDRSCYYRELPSKRFLAWILDISKSVFLSDFDDAFITCFAICLHILPMHILHVYQRISGSRYCRNNYCRMKHCKQLMSCAEPLRNSTHMLVCKVLNELKCTRKTLVNSSLIHLNIYGFLRKTMPLIISLWYSLIIIAACILLLKS